MSQPCPTSITTREDVYLLYPDLKSFRDAHPHHKSDDVIDCVTVTATDEEAYLRTRGLALRKRPSTSPSQAPTHSTIKAEMTTGLLRTASPSIASRGVLSRISNGSTAWMKLIETLGDPRQLDSWPRPPQATLQ